MTTTTHSTDAKLGRLVRQHLLSLGVETPFNLTAPLSEQAVPRKVQIANKVREIMTLLGLDMSDDSLMDTPDRVAKMYLKEIFYGLDYDNFPKCTVVDNKMKYNEMVMEKNIIVNSTCEHHLLPIVGRAFVAYIPEGKVLGLSKMNRLVDFFSRRPQIQERLTEQIYRAMCFILETDNVAVCIDAEHMCVKTRGVMDACSDTVTSKLGGAFMDSDRVRSEFYSLMRLPKL